MFPRFERRRRGLAVGLVHNRKINRKVRSERLGRLGAVHEPISVSERIRFWMAIDRRLAEIEAKHPGRITPDDTARIKAAIAKRIPTPTKRELRKATAEMARQIDAFSPSRAA